MAAAIAAAATVAAAAAATAGSAAVVAGEVQGGNPGSRTKELEVAARQAFEEATRTMRGEIEEEGGRQAFDLHPECWLVEEGKPQNAEIRKQLRRLQAKNRPGTLQSATATMERGVESARKTGGKEPEVRGPTGTWANLVKDGEGCAEWAKRCQRGEVPPAPFKTHGRVGKDERFSLSAMREWLREQQTTGAEEGSGPGVGRTDREWEKRGMEGVTRGEILRRVTLAKTSSKPRERQSAEAFLEKMRPEGFSGTPQFVQLLKEGALDKAEDFWR